MSTNVEKDMLAIQDNSADEVPAISTLPPKMQRFIQLYMTGQYTLSKLSQLLEVHPNTLGNWLRRKDVQEIIHDMQEATHQMVGIQLKALTLKAVNKLGNLTDSPIDGVALAAVKDILDRSGHKPKQEIKVDKTVVTIEEKLKNLIDSTIDAEYRVIEDGND
jgi:glutamyl-tRNA reductase